MNWHLIWEVLAILGLILTAIYLLLSFRSKIDKTNLGDSGCLRSALKKWEPLVLERDKTLRGVKRFSNRARFLTSNETGKIIPQLVGLIALDEVRWIDSVVDQFDYGKWKDGEPWSSIRPILLQNCKTKHWVETIESFLKTVTIEHWEHYRALVTGGRFQSKEPDSDTALEPEKNHLSAEGEQ